MTYTPNANQTMNLDTFRRHQEVARALADARRREVAAIRDQERIVVEARFAGIPWSVIGDALGVTRQAAQQRYGQPENHGS